MGHLGSHHTTIEVEAFRGFALADDIAPFVVLNDQDAKTAWSFTLIHELAHLWLGTTGVSGAFADAQIEKFCNDVAGGFLLPANELPLLRVDSATDLATAAERIGAFAEERHLSNSMVAYSLLRAGFDYRGFVAHACEFVSGTMAQQPGCSARRPKRQRRAELLRRPASPLG